MIRCTFSGWRIVKTSTLTVYTEIMTWTPELDGAGIGIWTLIERLD